MIRLICRLLLIALGVVACLTARAGHATPPQRIVAVGDLHGDFESWRAIALSARLIDRRDRWAGGSSILVQTGDIVDRGPDSLKIIRHLMKLKREATRAGGRVIVLVGNHEAMNMTGDLRYVHPREFAAFADSNSARLRERVYQTNKTAILAAYRARSPAMAEDAIYQAWIAQSPLGKLEHRAAWSPKGEFGRWTMANPAVAKIGDTLFVHGGISVRYAGIPLDEINRRVAAAFSAGNDAPDAIINDPYGPLWYRGLVTRQPEASATLASGQAVEAKPAMYPSIDEELATVLRSFGARRIVVAHTPMLSGIVISHGGRLARIDTGISRYYGGKLSYLEITDDRLVPHHFERSRNSL